MSTITLSGLDGSGKSTQIELLKDYLKSQDKTFFYFHAVEFSVGNKGLKAPIGALSPGKSVTKANWLQIQLRKIALLVDIFRFKRLTKKLNVNYIISDRYFYDSVVNIEYLSCRRVETQDFASLRNCGMTKWIEKFIPRSDFAFYIDVKPKTIMKRERKPDQGLEYLKAKEKLFEQKIKDWDIIVIDGEKNKEEIFANIINNFIDNGKT